MAKKRFVLVRYGIDCPGRFWDLLLFCGLGLIAGSLVPAVLQHYGLGHYGPGLIVIGFAVAGLSGLLAFLRLIVTIAGKPAEARMALASIPWRGDEKVLDIGCGRGILLVGAAQKAPQGQVVGVDIWRRDDMTGNHPDLAQHNLTQAGVAERVVVQQADARDLPFPRETFDVVFANLVLFCIKKPADREKALKEAFRVLKPGGRLVVVDPFETARVEKQLQREGALEIQRSNLMFLVFPSARRITARKAG